MNPLNKSGHLSHLSHMCINHSKLMTRMALICFQTNKYPAYIEMTVVFIKYIQLISQVVLFNFYLHGYSEDYASDWYSKGVIFIAKLFNPAFWMPYENRDLLVFCVLIGIMCFMALRYSLFAYVVWVAYKDRDGDPRLIKLWGYVFKIQGRAFYSLLSTFFVNTILTFSSDGLSTPKLGRGGLIVWCVFMIVLEYSFSLFLQIRFCYALPARGLLGCKDNRTEMILLTQKLAIHLLAIVLKKHSTTSLWVFSSINLLFCIGRDWEYFTGLPFYNLWTLKYQGVLLEVFTSLNVACFIQSIAKSSNFAEIDMAFIIVVWIITGALFIKLALQYLENIKIQVIMEPRHASPDLLTISGWNGL